MNPSEGDYEQRTPGPSMAISVFVMDSPGSDFLFTWGGVDVLWWLALKKGDEIKQPAQGCDVIRHVPVEGFFVDARCVSWPRIFRVWWEPAADGGAHEVRVEGEMCGGGVPVWVRWGDIHRQISLLRVPIICMWSSGSGLRRSQSWG